MRRRLHNVRRIISLLAVSLFMFTEAASAHTPDWTSRVLEWVFGRKAAVGEAPSAGWMEPKSAPEFQLVNQNGQGISLRDLQGKVVLLNFIHAGCEDSCSSMTELKILANALGGRMGKEVIFISITLDAEQDTPAALHAVGQGWEIGPGWQLLTGSSDAIEKLAEAYGVYVKRIEASHMSGYQGIEYSDVILFLDQEGRLRKRVLPHLLRLSGRRDVEWLLETNHH